MKKETKKAPTIRFRGFTDDWEQHKLGECCQEFKSGSFIPASDIGDVGKYPVYGGNGLRGFSSEYNHDGEFALIGRQGALCGNMNYSLGKAYFTEHAIAVQANKTADTKFLYYLLRKMNLGQYSDQSAQPGLAVGKLVKLTELFPSVTEQIKIGHQFMGIDNLITLHQRKLNQLKTLKKYFLQNMFPAKGEKVPRIRFKGFTGDWEQRKLEDLASFSKGAGYSKSDLQVSGTPIVLYGRLYTKYETVIKDVDTFVDALANSVYSQGGEVIVPASGETAEDISIASVVEKPGIVLGGDLNIIHPSDDLDSTFLAISISNGNPHKEMAKRAQGKSVVHLHNNDLAQIKLLYPSVTEQRKISQYFSGLDTLITLHQHKLDQLQIMKKFMLQNMFI